MYASEVVQRVSIVASIGGRESSVDREEGRRREEKGRGSARSESKGGMRRKKGKKTYSDSVDRESGKDDY